MKRADLEVGKVYVTERSKDLSPYTNDGYVKVVDASPGQKTQYQWRYGLSEGGAPAVLVLRCEADGTIKNWGDGTADAHLVPLRSIRMEAGDYAAWVEKRKQDHAAAAKAQKDRQNDRALRGAAVLDRLDKILGDDLLFRDYERESILKGGSNGKVIFYLTDLEKLADALAARLGEGA